MRVDTTERQPLDTAVLRAWRVRNTAVTGLIGGVLLTVAGLATAAGAVGGTMMVVAGALAVAALSFGWWYAGAAYQRWSVRFAEAGVEMERGVVIRTRTVMPYFRLQHVDVQEGPFDRWFGLAQLVLFTAAPSEKAEIPGIARDRIDAVQRHVVERADTLDAV